MSSENKNKVMSPNETREMFKEDYLKIICRKLYYKIAPFMIKHKNDEPEIKKGMRIIFVCYGNICRSPFAELYAKKHYTGFKFSSSGFIEEPFRSSPENAVIAAQSWNIDMSGHKSNFLTQTDIDNSDVIFIMDRKNYLMFKNKFRNDTAKVFYLDANKDINDPWQTEVENFKNIYSVIADNIDRIFHTFEP